MSSIEDGIIYQKMTIQRPVAKGRVDGRQCVIYQKKALFMGNYNPPSLTLLQNNKRDNSGLKVLNFTPGQEILTFYGLK